MFTKDSNFWKRILQGNQFGEICRLSNQEPGGILGISVYENPKEMDTNTLNCLILRCIRFVMDSRCMDIPKYGLQSIRRTDKKCII